VDVSTRISISKIPRFSSPTSVVHIANAFKKWAELGRFADKCAKSGALSRNNTNGFAGLLKSAGFESLGRGQAHKKGAGLMLRAFWCFVTPI